MKVAHVSFYIDPSMRSPGACRELWDRQWRIAALMRGVRTRFILATPETWPAGDRDVEIEGVGMRSALGHIPRGTRWIAGGGRLLSAVGRFDPDVIHVHGLIAPFHVRRLRRAFPATPMLIQDHASIPWRGPGAWIRRQCFSGASAVVFTARDQARPFVEAGALGASVPILEVIEASSTFTPGDRHAARGASGVDGDPALLWVGRLDPNKDPMRVLDAVEIAMGRLPGLRLWCLFDAAPLGTAVRERLGRHPALSRGVRLVGPVPHRQVEAFCRAADLFVLGSHREGSGYALIEALACGVTPVVTDIPSFRRITRDGKVGELVPVDDAGRMAEAIVKQSGRIGEASRRRVREHFERCLSETAVADELRNAYAVLTGGA